MVGYRNIAAERLHEPGMIYGKEFDGENMNFLDAFNHMGEEAVINGFVEEVQYHELRGNHLQVTIVLKDASDNNTFSKLEVALLTYTHFKKELDDLLTPGLCICACGILTLDHFTNKCVLGAVTGIKRASGEADKL